MNSLPRCCLWAVAAQTLLFGVCAAQPDLAERLDLDVWTVPDRERQIAQAQSDMDRADVRLHELIARSENRDRIADAVASGQIGLLEAADRFRELNAATSSGSSTLSVYYPGDTDEERCCRQVMAWVTTRLAQKSTVEAEMVAERLEEELRRHLLQVSGEPQRG